MRSPVGSPESAISPATRTRPCESTTTSRANCERAPPKDGGGEPVAAAEGRVEAAAAVEAGDEDLPAGRVDGGERVAGGDDLAAAGDGEILNRAGQAEVDGDDAVLVIAVRTIAEVVVERAGAFEAGER